MGAWTRHVGQHRFVAAGNFEQHGTSPASYRTPTPGCLTMSVACRPPPTWSRARLPGIDRHLDIRRATGRLRRSWRQAQPVLAAPSMRSARILAGPMAAWTCLQTKRSVAARPGPLLRRRHDRRVPAATGRYGGHAGLERRAYCRSSWHAGRQLVNRWQWPAPISIRQPSSQCLHRLYTCCVGTATPVPAISQPPPSVR